MKKIIFVGLFALLFIGCAGQTKQENHWLIGSWEGEDSSFPWMKGFITATFNKNGTGTYRGEEIEFSINDNLLTMFYIEDEPIGQYDCIIHKINEQKIILEHPTYKATLNKINN